MGHSGGKDKCVLKSPRFYAVELTLSILFFLFVFHSINASWPRFTFKNSCFLEIQTMPGRLMPMTLGLDLMSGNDSQEKAFEVYAQITGIIPGV